MKLYKNIKLFYIYSLFDELLIIGPIMVIYLFFKGFSFSEIMLLQSISAIAIVIFEVPTGAIADKVGRKFSIGLSKLMWILSLLIYILGTSFLDIAIAEIVFSIGITLKSGADSALLYDSLKALDREEEFTKIQGRARSNIYITQGIGAIVASFVYSINEYLPMIFSIGFMIIAFVVVLLFEEPPIEDKKGKYGEKYFTQIKESGKYVIHHPKIKSIAIFAMIFFAFMRAGFWFYQPYMESVNVSVKYFGIFFFFFNMTAALASSKSNLIISFSKKRTFMFMIALLWLSFLILGFSHHWLAIMAILPQQVARGLYSPVINKYSNKHIPSNKRATVLSFISLASSLSAAIVLPMIGVLKDKTDIFTSYTVIGVILIVIMFFLNAYLNKSLKKSIYRV